MNNNPDTGPDNRQSGNILIVDDNPVNLRLLIGILGDQGYKTRAAPSGPRAIMAAQAAPPDLILLDIKMPDMDGYEVCRQLKAQAKTRDIPIIFISALDEVMDKVRAFTAGGVDYITKPFQVEEVLARVETHLTLQDLQQKLKAANRELEKRLQQLESSNQELQEAMARVKTLSGLLPICASCKKIRDDQGYWQLVEVYLRRHSQAEFSHGLCPDCARKLYPEFYSKEDS